MKTLKHLSLVAIAAGLFLAAPHTASAQVSVEIGARLCVRMDTTRNLPTTALPTASMAPSGFQEAYS